MPKAGFASVNSTFASFVESGIVLISSVLFVIIKPCRFIFVRFVRWGNSAPIDLQKLSICKTHACSDVFALCIDLPYIIFAGIDSVSPGPMTQCPILAITASVGCKFSSKTGIAFSMPKFLLKSVVENLQIFGKTGRRLNNGRSPSSTILSPNSGLFWRSRLKLVVIFLIDKFLLDKASLVKVLLR